MNVNRLTEEELNTLAVDVACDRVYCVNDEESVRLSFGHLFGMVKQEDLPVEVIEQIGAIYERYDKAGPRSINGRPFFFSMNFLHKQDLPLLVAKVEAKRKALNDA